MEIENIPKVELHVHLDCSLSYELVSQFLPGISRSAYEAKFHAPDHCRDLAAYLSRAVNGIKLMQTPQQLEMAVEDLFRQFAKDKVIYAEIRFAPLEHTRRGLTPAQVVGTVNEAVVKEIGKSGIECRILLCTLRHYSAEQSMETARLVERFHTSRVAGFDIAGDESAHPLDPHVPAFQYLRNLNIPCTAHAGEAKGAKSVWESINRLQPARIGHGVNSWEDDQLTAYLQEKNIHLEICPTSNIQTGIFEHMEDHLVDRFYRKGISLSINTDGRSLSNTDLRSEYRKLAKYFGWSQEHFHKCNKAAIDAAFISKADKEILHKKLMD